MKTKALLACLLVGLSMLAAPALRADLIKIDFTAFPGADKILGTADDLPVTPHFTSEYAFLSGGVGFTVDSLCCEGGEFPELGAITNLAGRNVLVQARPDLGPAEFDLGDLAINFVTSSDGMAHTSVQSVDVRFNVGATGSISFFNSRDDLRFRTSVPASGSGNVLYSDADGIARIVINGSGAINLLEFDASAPITVVPPDSAAPEPAALSLMGVSLALLAARWRKIRRIA